MGKLVDIDEVKKAIDKAIKEQWAGREYVGLSSEFEDGIVNGLDRSKGILDELVEAKKKKPSIVDELRHYLATTPKEEVERKWEELKEWGKVGPTVSEFLGWEKPVSEDVSKEKSLSLQIQAYLNTCSDELYAEGKPLYSEYRQKEIHDCMAMWKKLHDYFFYNKPFQSVSEGLEEEMDKFFETMPVLEHENIFEDTFKNIARHFAQWGAEWQKEQDNAISRQAEATRIKTQQMCYEKGQTDMKEQMMIQWTGNNLKDIIEFTGKSPRFNEWFKSWDDYEDYVHSHGDILKLFNEDGTHLEVPVGAWIVKTPDGRNVPSTFLYKEQPVCEDVEEEAESCWRIVFPDGGIETTKMALTHDEFMMCARHFAKWGAEHLKK